MPRRKITIEEAFSTLEEAGIPIQVKPAIAINHVEVAIAEQVPVSTKPKRRKGQIFDIPSLSPKPPTMVKVTLFAKHSIGSGGSLVIGTDGNRVVESAGIESYGPGICTIPIELVQSLLHADMVARQADANFLDTTQHSYLVVPRQAESYRANVRIEVPDGLLNGGLGTLPGQYMFVIQ